MMAAPEPPRMRPMEASEHDAGLVERWRAGEQSAAEALIRRHAGRLQAFAVSRGIDVHEAQDIVQEVFIAVCRQLPAYRSAVPFGAWIYGIARHKIADVWRRPRPAESFEPSHEPIDERSPARLHEQAESGALAWAQVFARLPEAQASALWLRVHEELPLESIALSLGVTLANTKVLLFRARQTLASKPILSYDR